MPDSELAALANERVNLLATDLVYVVNAAGTVDYKTTLRNLLRDIPVEPFIGGLQELRRVGGLELRTLNAAMGAINRMPVNFWFVGDSLTEGFGSSSDYERWIWLVREALQSRFRTGGVSWIPVKRGATPLYSANPDGKNQWALTAGTLVDNVNYGYGFGQHAAWMNNGARYEITVDCDRFWIQYTAGGTGNMRVTVDPLSAFETITNVATAAGGGAGGWTQSGRIYDSGAILRGPHIIRVESTDASTVILDGIFVFDTDVSVGVHAWNGGASGAPTASFSGDASGGSNALWADAGWQPHTWAQFADGVTNGTTTFTSATATFVANDVGDWVVFKAASAAGIRGKDSAAKIVGFTNGTTVTLDRTLSSATGITFRISRAQVTDAVLTSGSRTVTSATAAWQNWDEGCELKGPTGLANGGYYVERVVSATEVRLNKNATVTQSAQTLRVNNRRLLRTQPDVVVVELFYNDLLQGVPPATAKVNAVNIIGTVMARSAIDLEPSVVLMPLFAIGGTADMLIQSVGTTNASAVLTSATAVFQPEDAGKSISGTGIPGGTTILSYQSTTQVTMSANATATGTVTITVTDRVLTDYLWQPYRLAQHELVEENGWRIFDLYTIAGDIGTDDKYRLTYDNTHTNDRGSRVIANEVMQVLVGQPKQSTIPAGIGNNKGEFIGFAAADTPVIVPAAKIPGQTNVKRENAPAGAGMGWESPGLSRSLACQSIVVPGTATRNTIGYVAATNQGTPASSDDVDGPWLNFPTASTAGSSAGLIASAFTYFQRRWQVEFLSMIKTDAALTNYRLWVGLFSADPGNVDTLGAIHAAAVRYSSVADGTLFWRSVTKNGTTQTTRVTDRPIAASTVYVVRIEALSASAGGPGDMVRFFINDFLVDEHALTLPGDAQGLGFAIKCTNPATGVKNIKVGRFAAALK